MASTAAEQLQVECRSCGAQITFASGERSATCPYCDSPAVVDRPETPDRPDPDFAIGFAITEDQAGRALRAWLSRRRLAPRALKRAAAERVRGAYVPCYLYSAVAETGYAAEIGEAYTETRYNASRKTTERVRKTEWRSLSGRHSCYLNDVVVTASAGIPNDELEAIEPYDLHQLRRYGPGMVAGWIAEEPSLARERCAELAQAEGREAIATRLGGLLPGDSRRGLRTSTAFRDEALELVLLPVWVFSLRWKEGKPPVRLLVNGATGKVGGSTPVSAAKLAALVVAAAGLVALVAWAVQVLS